VSVDAGKVSVEVVGVVKRGSKLTRWLVRDSMGVYGTVLVESCRALNKGEQVEVLGDGLQAAEGRWVELVLNRRASKSGVAE